MTSAVRRAWVPALFWLAVIAWESTAIASASNTEGLLRTLLQLFVPHLSIAHLEFINHILRKTGHFAGYGILCIVMFRAWWATLLFADHPAAETPRLRAMVARWSGRAASLALFSTALVASLDEWHQAYLPGRTSSGWDILLDSCGGIVALLFLFAFSSFFRTRLEPRTTS